MKCALLGGKWPINRRRMLLPQRQLDQIEQRRRAEKQNRTPTHSTVGTEEGFVLMDGWKGRVTNSNSASPSPLSSLSTLRVCFLQSVSYAILCPYYCSLSLKGWLGDILCRNDLGERKNGSRLDVESKEGRGGLCFVISSVCQLFDILFFSSFSFSSLTLPFFLFFLSFSSLFPASFFYFIVNTSFSPFQHLLRRTLHHRTKQHTSRLNLIPKHTETHKMDAPRESKSSKRIKAEYSELKLRPHNGIHAGKFARISLSTISSL